MRRSLMVLAVPVLLLLSFSAFAQRGGLVGNIRGDHNGCGCSFSFNKADLKASRQFFFEDLDDTEVWMNIDGHDLKLHLVDRHNPKGAERVGTRSTAKYAGDGITVDLVRIVTWVCPHRDEACEVTHYSATFTVKKGKRTQVVKAVGDCGC